MSASLGILMLTATLAAAEPNVTPNQLQKSCEKLAAEKFNRETADDEDRVDYRNIGFFYCNLQDKECHSETEWEALSISAIKRRSDSRTSLRFVRTRLSRSQLRSC
jgi:hypothetical protein